MRGSHGTFYWNELMTRDVEGAKKFYADTIGWSYDGMPMPGGSGTYWLPTMDGEPGGGPFGHGGLGFSRRAGELDVLHRGRRRRRPRRQGGQGRRQADEAGVRRARRRPHRHPAAARRRRRRLDDAGPAVANVGWVSPTGPARSGRPDGGLRHKPPLGASEWRMTLRSSALQIEEQQPWNRIASSPRTNGSPRARRILPRKRRLPAPAMR